MEKFLAVSGLCLLGVIGIGLVGYAQPPAAQPGDYFWEEFAYGLLGGLVGGPVLEGIYVSSLCRETPDPMLCEGLGIVALRTVVYLVTLPAGVSFGIFAGGWLFRGVPGNLLFTYGFATVGSITGLAWAAGIINAMEFFIDSLEWEFLRPWVAPVFTVTRLTFPIFLAALLGTVGFNSDVKMPLSGTPLPISFSAPLFEVRF